MTSSEIWEEHSDKLKTFICNKVNHDDVCHDILHDVFLKITQKEDRIKWIEQQASYVFKMAQNAIVDHYRSQKSHLSFAGTPEAFTPGESPEYELADCCLMSFVQKLPQPYREAIILTEFEGISQKELAEKLDISYSGAKSRIQRAKKMLKETILACCPYQFDKYRNIIGCCK
jgi:RNA polymerase sigma-70 factor (ECF subfamily)